MREQEIELRSLCECGCGQLARSGNRFICNHHRRGSHTQHSEETKSKMSSARLGDSNPFFGKKHSSESRRKISIALTGRSLSDSHKQKVGLSKKGFLHTEEAKDKMRQSRLGKTPSKETKEKQSRTMTGRKYSAEHRRHISENNKGMKGKCHSVATKQKMSVSRTHMWANMDKEKRHKWIRSIHKAVSRVPNKPETFLTNLLDDLFPGEWKYVGDGQMVIAGKCPDFVNINGQKKIIELFGDYWHRGDDPEDRKRIFSPFGFDTLVIWEHELKKDSLVETTSKIVAFATQ